MMIKKTLKTKILAFSVIAGLPLASKATCSNMAVIAELDQTTQTAISYAVDTRTATTYLKNNQGNDVFYFHRPDCKDMHITLDIFTPAKGGQFSGGDVNHLEEILKNFKSHASNLNQNKKAGKKTYYGNAYELRLFAHHTNGTSVSYAVNPTPKSLAEDIKTLPQNGAVKYANIVARLGTYNHLRSDWVHTQKHYLSKPKNASVLKRNAAHHLQTHVTVGTLCKYDKDANGKKYTLADIQNLKAQGKYIHSTPFAQNELTHIVNFFEKISFNNTPVVIDQLKITTKDKQGIRTLKTVKL